MRDRLIELMKRCVSRNIAVCVDDWETEVEIDYNKLADHLLANGVILPPCKVGDVVYRISGNFRGEKIYEGAVDQIVVHDNGEVVFFVYGHPLRFNKYDLGKTVFLTREEAEKALKSVTDTNVGGKRKVTK